VRCGALPLSPSLFKPGPFWGKKKPKMMIWAGGENGACVCFRESGRESSLLEDGSSAAGKNLPVSTVFKRPPQFRMRGQPSRGGHLARTAENSGPHPKPAKINGKAPTSSRDPQHRAPPNTAHLRVSTYRCHVCPCRGDRRARGHSGQVCPPFAMPTGAWRPSSGCPCGTVPSCPYLDTRHVTESQNVRGWKGPLWITQSNPPTEAGSPRAGCTGPCPDGS